MKSRASKAHMRAYFNLPALPFAHEEKGASAISVLCKCVILAAYVN
jgi:hypothetical protein